MELRETEREPEAATRAIEKDESGPDRSHTEADGRALRAVSTGTLGHVDHAGARSLQRMAGNQAMTAVLQRKSAEEGDLDGSAVHDVVGKGGGQSLPEETQSKLAGAFGADVSNVRVHTDSAAQASAKAVQAKAYTVGNDIVLGEGHSLGSAETDKTLAHEVTHTFQQAAGPVDGTAQGGNVSVSDPGDRFEREAHANEEKVASGGFADVASAGVSSSGLQRQAEETVQRDELAGAPAVQRMDDLDDEDQGGPVPA